MYMISESVLKALQAPITNMGVEWRRPLFFVESLVLVAFEEDVRDPEAYAGEVELDQGTTYGLAMLGEVKIVAADVPGERLVWAGVELPPVCYPGNMSHHY
jgi:hypothetical protein